MKRISRQGREILAVAVLLAWTLGSSALALDVPPLTGRVVDVAGALPASVRDRLTTTLAEHERTTGNQVAVLVVPSLEGQDVFEYTHRVASAWQLGRKGTDNGVMLFVAIRDRKVRIEVGYGLEGTLTDARSAQIIRHEIVPRFRAGDIPGGVVAGVQAILETIAGTYVAPVEAPAGMEASDRVPDIVLAVIAGLVVGVIVSGVNRTVGPLTGGVISLMAAPWLWPAVIAAGVTGLLLFLFGAHMNGVTGRTRGGRRVPDDGWWYSSRDGGWTVGSGGGWSGGSDSGFSGGGGSFGGGGASGDW